jgi:hypothetical protein
VRVKDTLDAFSIYAYLASEEEDEDEEVIFLEGHRADPRLRQPREMAHCPNHILRESSL